ncbi:MAG: hemolysin family protein [Proteocatella sp.]
MEDGVGRYIKNFFNRPLGIVASNWSTKKRSFKISGQEDKDRAEDIAKEEFINSLEEDETVKQYVNDFERNMITKVLKLYDLRAKDIMTPRTSVFAVDINDEITDILDEMIEERYSRVPVYDKDIDNIIGVLHVKDIFAQVRKGNLELVNLRGLIKEPYFIHEYKPIDKLLIEMQRDRTHMGLIIDEYGGFAGILTIEDIIEEIVGDIDDEDDEPESLEHIQKISDTTYKVDGYVSVSEINDELNLNLPTDITETIGALLLGELGKIPTEDKDKSSAIINGVELKAIKVNEKRIVNLLLKIKV